MTAPRCIFKISPPEAWRAALLQGAFRGSCDDVRDGYIHMSTAAQLSGTLERHFHAWNELVIAAVDVSTIVDKLVWEPARDGSLFPHIYGELPMSAVIVVYTVERGADGRHVLPAEIAAP